MLTPFVGVSAFVALSADIGSKSEKARAVLRTTLAVAIIMLLFLFGGNYLFRLFGITLPAFQIAGGIIIFLNGVAMVRAHKEAKYTAEEAHEATVKDDFSIVPLAIPMFCGPATISTVILYAADADATRMMALVGAIIAASVVIYILLRLAADIARFLGITGMNILTRIMGLLVASLAVEIIMRGLTAAYRIITTGIAAGTM